MLLPSNFCFQVFTSLSLLQNSLLLAVVFQYTSSATTLTVATYQPCNPIDSHTLNTLIFKEAFGSWFIGFLSSPAPIIFLRDFNITQMNQPTASITHLVTPSQSSIPMIKPSTLLSPETEEKTGQKQYVKK